MASDPILANQLKSSDGRFQSSTIGYWFMYSLPPYYTDGINWPIDEWPATVASTFAAFSADQQAATISALALFSNVINVTFSLDTNPDPAARTNNEIKFGSSGDTILNSPAAPCSRSRSIPWAAL
jgi:hypothetical protein